MTKIVITGGHHSSALVVAQLLKKQGVEVIWLGHRYSSRGDTHDSAEYLEVTASGIRFYDLTAGRFSLKLSELVRLPLGLLHAGQILHQVKPDAILTFGGYLGAAVALAGSLRGIPLYLHEQTHSVGLANKLIALFAKAIYLTWPDSLRHFDPRKSSVIGLPLRSSILRSAPKQFFSNSRPTLLVMGGKQGSAAINAFVFAHLRDLLRDYNLIHQTGTSSLTHDYETALAHQDSLGAASSSYLPLGYISQAEIGTYLRSANVYLGRSGAHISYELAVLGIPSVLVPFMYTHDHEQYQNAQYLVSIGLGKIVTQSNLFLPAVLSALKQIRAITISPPPLPQNAAEILTLDILKDLRAD